MLSGIFSPHMVLILTIKEKANLVFSFRLKVFIFFFAFSLKYQYKVPLSIVYFGKWNQSIKQSASSFKLKCQFFFYFTYVEHVRTLNKYDKPKKCNCFWRSLKKRYSLFQKVGQFKMYTNKLARECLLVFSSSKKMFIFIFINIISFQTSSGSNWKRTKCNYSNFFNLIKLKTNYIVKFILLKDKERKSFVHSLTSNCGDGSRMNGVNSMNYKWNGPVRNYFNLVMSIPNLFWYYC